MHEGQNLGFMKKQVKQKKLGIIIGLLIILFIFNVYLSQLIFGLNLRLSAVNQKNSEQVSQISYIKIKLSQTRSIDLILKKAKQLGFVKSEQILYLNQREPLAKHE